jgi:hypothetical protein
MVAEAGAALKSVATQLGTFPSSPIRFLDGLHAASKNSPAMYFAASGGWK